MDNKTTALVPFDDANAEAQTFQSLLARYAGSSDMVFDSLEHAEQLLPDVLRLHNGNIGLTDGGVITEMEPIRTKFGETILINFMRPDTRTAFTVLFPGRIVKAMTEKGWGEGDVILFRFDGYTQLEDDRRVKNIKVVKVGTMSERHVDAPAQKPEAASANARKPRK